MTASHAHALCLGMTFEIVAAVLLTRARTGYIMPSFKIFLAYVFTAKWCDLIRETVIQVFEIMFPVHVIAVINTANSRLDIIER